MAYSSIKLRIICLDFESTLVPEFWPEVANELGIEELRITTREFPDFAELMKRRIKILNEHGIKLERLVTIADNAGPLPGAQEFIHKLQDKIPRIVIVSEFAEQLAAPMIKKFGGLTYFGHAFDVETDGTITGYNFRQENPKLKVVEAMRSLNLEVYAAGDSHNDAPMLLAADKSILFRGSAAMKLDYPQIECTDSYNELLAILTSRTS